MSSLEKVSTTTVSSATPSVSLTGIDSSNVYVVMYKDVQPATDAVKLQVRFLASGSPNTSSNYAKAVRILRTSTDPNIQGDNGQTSITSLDQGGTATEETLSGIHYLFNFNDSSNRSVITIEGSARSSSGELNARNGGAYLAVNEAHNGIQYFFSSGNIASGVFSLYKLKDS